MQLFRAWTRANIFRCDGDDQGAGRRFPPPPAFPPYATIGRSSMAGPSIQHPEHQKLEFLFIRCLVHVGNTEALALDSCVTSFRVRLATIWTVSNMLCGIVSSVHLIICVIEFHSWIYAGEHRRMNVETVWKKLYAALRLVGQSRIPSDAIICDFIDGGNQG